MVNMPQRKASLQVNDFGVDEIFSDEIQYLPPSQRAKANSLTDVPPLPFDLNVEAVQVITKRAEDGADGSVITVTVDIHAEFSHESKTHSSSDSND